jgi:DNA (cytosine-5)-methyltransferase 1
MRYAPKFRALDLFCGAGGATKGLQYAGFHVTGVDICKQPRYCGDKFFQSDALLFPIDGFDFIWASPPCQAHSRMSQCRVGLASTYPDHIGSIRDRLRKISKAYIIENVVGAPLSNPVMLCGSMFGLTTYRHRLFEHSGFSLLPPFHPFHRVPTSKAGHWKSGTFVSVAGHCAPIDRCRNAMGIEWMNREELAESIPPVYAEYIGRRVIARLLKF